MKNLPRLAKESGFRANNQQNEMEELKASLQEELQSIKDEENPYFQLAFLGELVHKVKFIPYLYSPKEFPYINELIPETLKLSEKIGPEGLGKFEDDLSKAADDLKKEDSNSLSKRLALYTDLSYNLTLLKTVPEEISPLDFEKKLSELENSLEELFQKKEASLEKKEASDLTMEKEDFMASFREDFNEIASHPHSLAYDKLFGLQFISKKLEYVSSITSLLNKEEVQTLHGELQTVTKQIEDDFLKESVKEREEILKNADADIDAIFYHTYPMWILMNLPKKDASDDFTNKVSMNYQESLSRFMEQFTKVHVPNKEAAKKEPEEETMAILDKTLQISMLKFEKNQNATKESIPLHDPSSSFKNGDIILKGRAGKVFLEGIEKGENQEKLLENLKTKYPEDFFKVEGENPKKPLQDFVSNMESKRLRQLFKDKFEKEKGKVQSLGDSETPSSKALIEYKMEKLSAIHQMIEKSKGVSSYENLLALSQEYQTYRRNLRGQKFQEWNQKKLVEDPQIKKRLDRWKTNNKADLTVSS